jgi:hypothetical protein
MRHLLAMAVLSGLASVGRGLDVLTLDDGPSPLDLGLVPRKRTYRRKEGPRGAPLKRELSPASKYKPQSESLKRMLRRAK